MARQVEKKQKGVRRFRPYPEYKDSGVEWLGEIPAHWETKRLRFLGNINPSPNELSNSSLDLEISFVPMDGVEEWGGLKLDSTKQLSEVSSGYTYFRNGDVLVAKITPCFENGKGAVAAGLTNETGFGTTELHVIRSTAYMSNSFLAYLTFSCPFRGLGQSVMKGVAGQQRVPENFIKNFRVPLPPVSEQQALSNFLDRETAKIDALVDKKERLIELLKEKRTALITRVVTKGLDPSGPMKDSGVGWLGEIPAHWKIKRAKEVFREVDVRSTSGDETLLGLTKTRGVVLREDIEQRASIADSYEGFKVCQVGDLVLNKLQAWNGVLGVSPYMGIISPDYTIFRAIDDFDLEFSAYLFRSPLYISEFASRSKGVGFGFMRLYTEDFGIVPTLVPPAAEQRAIAAFLDRETAKIDALVDKINEASDRLKEYRTALISAAVTGKIDVREEVA